MCLSLMCTTSYKWKCQPHHINGLSNWQNMWHGWQTWYGYKYTWTFNNLFMLKYNKSSFDFIKYYFTNTPFIIVKCKNKNWLNYILSFSLLDNVP